ncbi:MAG: rhodanese-like domain-containing protein [Jannaschia helgolandensis]|jgi:rhodanese-related sulfurtransferase|uniref:Rhodanese-related sulfurtransferase n=1 Tax=Jannaschia helgolandensis TaxID=188906 RepID=A0A1H7MCV5_9RHOB|nr:rhodanese-like domain-containing protein [Jannaschia helgolandensis]SEL08899.1 Rhodanese-related sulfurtransferase [Jannaschia helgolandensis]|tara:strand:+ start:798 stop:1175 length:378 start_codon:yes stop_codon:yes gene_type:complete
MKSAKDYLEAANAEVPRIKAAEAIAHHKDADATFVDVRDSADIAKTGTIAGAVRVPRGFIEFAADDASPYHNAALKKDAKLYLVCGAGGQAALAGKTLTEMGFSSVTNVGGIGDWKEAGGAMEDA